MKIDREEAHVAILCFLLAAALGRAHWRMRKPSETTLEMVGKSLAVQAALVGMAVFLMLILPGRSGLFAGASWFALCAISVLAGETKDDNSFPPRAVVWSELIGVLCFTILAVAFSKAYE